MYANCTYSNPSWHLAGAKHRLEACATQERDCYGGKRTEYDFSQGRRAPVVSHGAGKARITIRLDQDILEWFKDKVHEAGGGNYQTLINQAPREYIQHRDGLLAETLRRVIKEELAEANS
jgi:uncharacterized protein (DUF4415 family)